MIVGIDFGTTNSSIAGVWSGGTEPVAFRVSSGREPYNTLLRTAVLDPSGSADGTVVGEEALERAFGRAHKGRLVMDFKKRLDLQRLREDIPIIEYKRGDYDFQEDTDLVIPVRVGYRSNYDDYYLTDVVASAARVLGSVLRVAQNEATQRREAIDRVFCGLPVSYGGLYRRRLLHAFLETGFFKNGHDVLDRVRFFYEPVAIAFAYGVPLEGDGKALVFDYGAGTLDLAIVGFESDGRGGVIPSRELALEGHPGAGNKMDELFEAWVLKRFPHLIEEKARLDSVGVFQAKREIERAKIRLSRNPRTILQYGTRQVEVTREDFEVAVAPELEEIGRSYERLLGSYSLEPTEIDLVVMAGGSSLLSIVHEAVERLVPHLPADQVRKAWAGDLEGEELAMTAVAKGLAAYGRQRQFKRVTPFALQVWSPESRSFHTVVERGQEFEPEGSPATPEGPLAEALQRAGVEASQMRLPKFKATIPVRPIRGYASIGIWEDIHGGKYLFGLVDIPCSGDSVDVEIVLTDSILPEVSVWANGDDPLTVSLTKLPARDIETMLHLDAEWLPLPASGRRTAEYTCLLTKPLRKGDYVLWLEDETRSKRSGRITNIRRCGEIRACACMDCWDSEQYVVDVLSENRSGDGQIAYRLSPCSDSIRLFRPRIDD